MRYMFDTVALNIMIKSRVDTAQFDKNHEYYITPVQRAEILMTKDSGLRTKLLEGLEVIENSTPVASVRIRSAPWGHFPWGHGPWGGGDGKYHPDILRRLSECRGNKSARGNNEDALIIEVCKMNRMTLVTNDEAAQKVSGDLGVSWVSVDAFLAGMGR